jgi:hypothetical protein
MIEKRFIKLTQGVCGEQNLKSEAFHQVQNQIRVNQIFLQVQHFLTLHESSISYTLFGLAKIGSIAVAQR